MSAMKPGRVWLRTWKTKRGGEKSAWAVDYSVPDPLTGRLQHHRKQFRTEAEALAWNARTFVDVEAGAHVPDSRSCTIAEAGEIWLATVKARGRERSTTDVYEQHLRLHINPRIGSLRLTGLTLPKVSAFQDALRKHLSAAMTRRIMGSLKQLLATAQVRGLVARNIARDLPPDRESGRDKRPLRIGIDIPTPEEVKAIIDAATGCWRPLLIVAALDGLRARPLSGRRWA